MSARYSRLATRFGAVVVLGLVLAFSAQLAAVQPLLAAGRTHATALLTHAGILAPSLVVAVAPSTPRPYVLPNLAGEAHYFGGLVLRTLVPSGASTGGLSLLGVHSGPLPLALAHYHAEVEAFYCLKGAVETFHDTDAGREVRADDFVLLAPRHVHSYRPVSRDFQLTLGMAPGGIDAFFRAAGHAYAAEAGPFDPLLRGPPLDPAQVLSLMPRYNITPKPGYALNMDWTNGSTRETAGRWGRADQALPESADAPYFVASGCGPKRRHRATGQVVAVLATGQQTAGLMSVATVVLPPTTAPPKQPLVFDVDHAVQVTEGQLWVQMAGATTPLIWGDVAFIPRGTEFRYWSTVGFTKAVVWAAGKGLVGQLLDESEPWSHAVWAPESM